MLTTAYRTLAVGTTAALISLGLMAAPASAAPATTPSSCSGVWVAVQFDDSSAAQLGCATSYATGTDMLESAGFSVDTSTSAYGLSLDKIDATPATTGGTLYWYQASATINADGSLGDWEAGSGFGVDTPSTSKISGFRLTDYTTAGWPPPGPAITSVPVASATPSSASPTPTASATPSSTPSAAAGVSAAGKWLSASVPSTWDSAGSALTVGIGLATRECTYSSTLTSIRSYLVKQADSYSATSAYAAAKLAVFASAVGDDPTDFGGVNLADRITAGAGSNGQLGSTKDFAFGQALAMIGLKRAGTTPSAAMVDYLLDQQLANGAWGFGSTADPDSTALALIALSDQVITPDATTTAAVDKAKAWAASTKKSAGYWANYSPVDSTSLMVSGLRLHQVSVTDSLEWLADVQLRNGGFANTLAGTTADQMATSSAMFALSGTSYATVSAPLDTCSASSDDSAKDDDSLANTGFASWPLGAAGLGLVVVGAALTLARREGYHPRHAAR